MNITKKQDLLMYSLNIFFCKKKNIKELLSILKDDNSKISLRIIDWFVTNYSKQYNIVYHLTIKRPNGSIINKQFKVYVDYKSQLKSYSKKQFDPFCRRNRIGFYYTNKDSIITTVGQLNFFRWAIQNKILDYIRKHLQEIETDMNNRIKHIYCKKVIKTKIRKTSRHKKRGKSQKKTMSDKIKPFVSKKIENGYKSKKKVIVEKNRKKRTQLSVAATKKINKHNTPVVIHFD